VGLFTHEFPLRTREYYEGAVRKGNLSLNGRRPGKDETVHPGNWICHYVHRHEPPVLDLPVELISQTSRFVAVNKPASMPVHPCGQHRKNTVMGYLKAFHPELGDLFPIHRLDKPVSGVLLFARNSSAADAFRQELGSGTVAKVYLARVAGEFPSELRVDAHILYDHRAKRARCAPKKGSSCQGVVEKAAGVDGARSRTACTTDAVDPTDTRGEPREAETSFVRRWTNGEHSVVECFPKTGRTHQIRVHLEFSGFPIVNDPVYGPREACANGLTTGSQIGEGCTAEGSGRASKMLKRAVVQATPDVAAGVDVGSDGKRQVDKADIDPDCVHCPFLRPLDYDLDVRPLWLHAMKYTTSEGVFEAAPPEWALP